MGGNLTNPSLDTAEDRGIMRLSSAARCRFQAQSSRPRDAIEMVCEDIQIPRLGTCACAENRRAKRRGGRPAAGAVRDMYVLIALVGERRNTSRRKYRGRAGRTLHWHAPHPGHIPAAARQARPIRRLDARALFACAWAIDVNARKPVEGYTPADIRRCGVRRRGEALPRARLPRTRTLRSCV